MAYRLDLEDDEWEPTASPVWVLSNTDFKTDNGDGTVSIAPGGGILRRWPQAEEEAAKAYLAGLLSGSIVHKEASNWFASWKAKAILSDAIIDDGLSSEDEMEHQETYEIIIIWFNEYRVCIHTNVVAYGCNENMAKAVAEAINAGGEKVAALAKAWWNTDNPHVH